VLKDRTRGSQTLASMRFARRSTIHSMTPSEAKLLEEALKLSPEARAALAGSLLDSLEAPPDPDAEALWEAEINHRIREIERGTARMVPWSEARRAILGG
jgi:putative addiction module component (TIGR02574 family)